MKRILGFLAALVCLLLLPACGQEEPQGENIYQVYYLSSSESKVEKLSYAVEGVLFEERLEELLGRLTETPDRMKYKAPLDYHFEINSILLDERRMLIDMNEDYKKLQPITEILVRAAIVRTLEQLPEVDYIGFTVEGNQFYDNSGMRVGWMNGSRFIDNDGNEINTYELAKVKLYFADESGTKLIASNREKHYSTNTLKERFVVEELIAGPSELAEGIYPTVNPNTRIISVMTKDGTCYVNLDSSFLTVVNNVPTETAIYSIVNSLIELSGVNKVQILINGEVPSTFSSAVYERNLDIVTTIEK